MSGSPSFEESVLKTAILNEDGTVRVSESAEIRPSQSQGNEATQVEAVQNEAINYQEEMILLFFNSMLKNIVGYTDVLEEIQRPSDMYTSAISTSYAISKRSPSRTSEKSIRSGIVSGEMKQLSGVQIVQEKSKEKLKQSDTDVTTPTKARSSNIAFKSPSLSKKGSGKQSLKSVGTRSSIMKEKRSSIVKEKKRSSVSLKRRSGSKKDVQQSTTDIVDVFEFQSSTIVEDQSKEEEAIWIVDATDSRVMTMFKNGNSYEGELERKMFHGKGIFRWSDGTVYEGDFCKGSITGKGKMILPDLGVYEGEFLKGNFHGSGTFNMQATPMVYNGFWKGCKKHGKGWMFYGQNNWYDGEWNADERHGLGLRQYKTGSRYNGYWHEGQRNGEGTMVWENNDFYKGAWFNGMIHGRGKYIWRTIKNNVFAFPAQNYYDGIWENGMRHGKGVMYFGTDNGAKLKGTWKNNLKEGAGTIICGNGKIMTYDPLFENDKPVHPFSNDQNKSNYSIHDVSASITRKQMKHISRQLSKLTTNMQKVQEGLRARYFCNPLELSIYTSVAYIEIGYYVDRTLQKFTTLLCPPDGFVFEQSKDSSSSFSEFNRNLSYSKWNILTLSSYDGAVNEDGVSVNYSKDKVDYYQYLLARNNEEKQMRNLIIKHLPELRQIYTCYANLTVDCEISFEPVMIRLFLWQFYTDIGIKDMNITLIETDDVLAANEDSAIESKHDPFEPIHFWQFILSLIGTCWLLCTKNEISRDTPHNSILAYLFKKFLDDVVFPEKPKSRALCLSKYLHLLPMKSVYSLYLKVGKPPTARDFLLHTCVRKKRDIVCVDEILQAPRKKPVIGSNVVPVGQEIVYIPDPVDIGQRPKDPLENVPVRTDAFFSSLKRFRILGARRILNLLTEVCPQIKCDGIIVNIDYPLTFLEFYEALILCGTTLLEREMRAERKAETEKLSEMNAESFLQTPKETPKQTAKRSREKKHKKN